MEGYEVITSDDAKLGKVVSVENGNLVVVDGSRSAGASLVEQTITAIR